MLKKIIKYKDYNDADRTQEFYFYLSQKDIKMLNAKTEGGIQAKFIKIMNKLDVKELLETVEDLILSAYGERSEDGTRFMKTPEIRENFKYSAAYEKLFDELTDSPEALAEFIKKILPNDVQAKIDAEEAKGNKGQMPELIAEMMKDQDAANADNVTSIAD